MSTRRAGELRFDHGAQYFTARDPRFADRVDGWQRDGLVQPWAGRIVVLEDGGVVPKDDGTRRFVAVPGMNAICRRLADSLDVSYGARVTDLEKEGGRWRVVSDVGVELGSFDAVVVSAPAPQTAALLEDVAPELAARAGAVEFAPCWALMAAYDKRLDLGFDGAFVHGSPLSWIARNASKPERPGVESWVLHGSPQWSQDHIEISREEAARRLLAAFDAAVGGLDLDPTHSVAHRWRYALPTEPLSEPFLYDAELGLAACGDWCSGPRVEGAFLSGRAVAEAILT
jgi:predicted NAD/FAD-dependent oxidoreductase